MIEKNCDKIHLSPNQLGHLLSRQQNGFTTVFDQIVNKILESHNTKVRFVLEDGKPPVGLLRSALEKRINEGVRSGCTIYLEEDGSLISVDQKCPYTIEPTELIRKLEEPLSKFSMEALRDEFDSEIWIAFLEYTKNRLNDLACGHQSTANLKNRVRGCSAELILRVLLRRIARPSSPRHQPVLLLIDSTMPLALPFAREGAEPRFALNFLPFHNCNLEAYYGSDKKTITELDAVAVTGLQPQGLKRVYSTMYFFDITTSRRELESKLGAEKNRLRGFRDFIEGNGIILHRFSIFIRDPMMLKSIDYLRALGQKGNHVVLLPLGHLVDEISEAAGEELGIDMDKQPSPAE